MVAAWVYDSKVWAAGIVVSMAREGGGGPRDGVAGGVEPWRDLDRQLRSVAARRGALDQEELTLIRAAVAIQIWRPLGMTSMREYLESRMGYGPKTAAERLRTAEALDALPALEEALASGELSYSAVRELTRIATRKTEEAWLDACQGKNLRQIEELVAEREPGDDPSAKPKPELRATPVTMHLRPAVRALKRQVQTVFDGVRGERSDDSDLMEEVFRFYLAYAPAVAAGDQHGDALVGEDARAGEQGALGEKDEEECSDGSSIGPWGAAQSRGIRRPRTQIAITRCDSCGQAWQLAAGRKVAITAAELETAECDALMVGSLDRAPERASSSIPPAARRLVMQRDQERCTVPGCRASQNVDVHHIVHREHGGGNEPTNLTVLCWGHHAALHRGEISITGLPPHLTVTRRWQVPHVGAVAQMSRVGAAQQVPPLEQGDNAVDVLLALKTLGFTKGEAQRALACAVECVGADAALEPLMRAALRACPKPG